LVLAMAAFSSACYVRTVRGDLPILYDEGEQFPFGGHKVLRRAPAVAKHVVLAACGYMVHSCLQAADLLSNRHRVEATVVDAYSLPLDSAPILALAGRGAAIVTVEDNYVGGLGSELAEAAAAAGDEAPHVQALCVHNIPKSGRNPEDVLAYVHLSVEEIVAVAAKAAR
jgi:transketolase